MIIKLHSNGLSDIMLYLGHVDFYTSVALKKDSETRNQLII